MADAVFEVSPAGIYGMNSLAVFLDALKDNCEIEAWRPKRAITESKGARYVVEFATEVDAAVALRRWRGSATNRSRRA